jgi:hypothetical protein
MDDRIKIKVDQLTRKIEALNKLIIILEQTGKEEILKKVLRTNDQLSLKKRLFMNGVIQ